MGSTPVARTTSKIRVRVGIIEWNQGLWVKPRFWFGLWNVVRKWVKITLVPEQEPEQLKGMGI
jgi:hypothetical protein